MLFAAVNTVPVVSSGWDNLRTIRDSTQHKKYLWFMSTGNPCRVIPSLVVTIVCRDKEPRP
jgi:hypothetical protein